MPRYQVPVLLTYDYQGFCTGTLAEVDLVPTAGFGPAETAAFDETGAGVLNQLKKLLTWWYQGHPNGPLPDFHDPELVTIPIEVRPEYTIANRDYPCAETISMRIPCIRGHTEAGLSVCSLPTLSIRYYLHKEAHFLEVACEQIVQCLSGMTPRELARLLPPKETQLESLSIRAPKPGISHAPYVPHLHTLKQSAQPVDQPAFRKRYSAAWQRDTELMDLVSRISLIKSSLLLMGDSGVGKSTLMVQAVHATARKKRLEDQEKKEKDGLAQSYRHRYWLTSAARLIAGMAYLGEWQERCEKIIGELSSIDGVLCGDRLIDLVQLGGKEPGGSIAAFMQPYLQSGELRIFCEATPAELAVCRRMLPGFVDLFQLFTVEELKGKRARDALVQLAETQTRDTKVTVDEQAIETVYRLFRRFLPYRAMPGQASGFVTDLFAEAQECQREQVATRDVVRRFIKETGLPETMLRDDWPLDPENIHAELAKRVLGQEDPCRVMAETISTFKVGLNDPQRPLGTFLFCGPTGVGKTELAKATSDYLFGHGSNTDRLIRLDMSEYSSPHTAQRFLNTDEGKPSRLIRNVRKQPFVVVLLDEIEKATAEVFDIMLGLLDEGRLTDRHGRTTNFCSAIIIMTSNLGTSSRQPVGFGQPSNLARDAEVRSFFRPEFFNRLDAVVNFQPLSFETCLNIVRKELLDLAGREGLARANLRLDATDRLVERLANDGFDDRYGARPLQRTLESRVVTALSRYLIQNPGLQDTEIHLDVDPEGNVAIRCEP